MGVTTPKLLVFTSVFHAAVVVCDLLDGEVSSPYVLNADNGSFQVSLRGSQNADRSSDWMGFSIDACLTADAWTCEEPFKMNFSFNNGSAPFKIGDCLIPFNQTWVKDLQQNTQFSMMLPRGSGMLKTMGTWVPDLTCGCGIQVNYTCAGLRLHDTTEITPKQPSSSVVPPKCPKGKIAVKKVNAEPSNRCTQKYGDASHGWEQNGLLCYPDCRSGYYGVGPVCWKSCPSDMHDGGVFCSKHTYVPHTRAVWPWSHCHHDERHYGFECIAKCRAGYKAYNAVALYYCAQTCPSGFTDAGLTCTKHSYGRGAGKPAIRLGAFVTIIAEATILSGLAVVAALTGNPEDDPPLIGEMEGILDEAAAAAGEPAALGPGPWSVRVASQWIAQGGPEEQQAALMAALRGAGLVA